MTKKSVAEASAELYKLLEEFTNEERRRIVKGTLTLFGDSERESTDHDDSFTPLDSTDSTRETLNKSRPLTR